MSKKNTDLMFILLVKIINLLELDNFIFYFKVKVPMSEHVPNSEHSCHFNH